MRSLPHFNPDDDPVGGPAPERVAELCRSLATVDGHGADTAIRRELADVLTTLAGHAAATPTTSSAAE